MIYPMWPKIYFKPFRAVLFSIGVCVFFMSLNVYFALNQGYVENINGTDVTICYGNKDGDFSIINAGSTVIWKILIKLPIKVS